MIKKVSVSVFGFGFVFDMFCFICFTRLQCPTGAQVHSTRCFYACKRLYGCLYDWIFFSRYSLTIIGVLWPLELQFVWVCNDFKFCNNYYSTVLSSEGYDGGSMGNVPQYHCIAALLTA